MSGVNKSRSQIPPLTILPVSRRARLARALVCLSILVLCACWWASGRGYKTWVFRQFNPDYGVHHYAMQPEIIRTRPADREGNVAPGGAFIAADVELPYRGKVVDGRSLNGDSVRLYRTNDGQLVPAVVNTSGAGDAIVLRPTGTLDANTQYTFEITPAVTDTAGHPFKSFTTKFWTMAGERLAEFPMAFEKIALSAARGHMFTCVTIGPDQKLYASALSGKILRYAIRTDGTVESPQEIDTINESNALTRLITGITFDPQSTADHLVLWVSHGQLTAQGEKGQGYIQGAADWTGKISRLEGPNLEKYDDVVIGLPRGWKDHLNNQMVFGPDHALYFCQAANTAMGAPDHKWGFRPERLLTAAILRLDVGAMVASVQPLNVKTEAGGNYDPYAPGAPLTIYATGIRNSFDLVWHSNGRLYAGINGSAAGGNAPASPPAYRGLQVPRLMNIQETEDDMLFKVEQGAYYGHPNPTRNEYVLNGANPAPHANPYQVHGYPLGTLPDRNWRPAIYSFGKNLSPCGVIEYQGPRGNDALKGKLLYVRYSGGDDIIALSLDRNGDVAESITGIEGFGRFVNPVDLIEDTRTGNIYVAEFGGKCITLLRPTRGQRTAANAVSRRTCRVQFGLTALTAGKGGEWRAASSE
ncbi:MAG TPA: Ig-like domain-containing protein [Tepidisphaeraceae bacterium]|jgi:hypothetical protein|nr:Ig-like domain-containing protein [Tepidisphaeraceae bacterium]